MAMFWAVLIGWLSSVRQYRSLCSHCYSRLRRSLFPEAFTPLISPLHQQHHCTHYCAVYISFTDPTTYTVQIITSCTYSVYSMHILPNGCMLLTPYICVLLSLCCKRIKRVRLDKRIILLYCISPLYFTVILILHSRIQYCSIHVL